MSLGFSPFVDFNVSINKAGAVSVEWLSISPQPTDEEVAARELTVEYSDWVAENGGDPTLARRKQAEDNLSINSNMLLRSVILTMVDEFNRHSDRTNAILDAIDGANNLSSLKSAIGVIDNIPARTGAQLRSAAIAKIRAGDSDS